MISKSQKFFAKLEDSFYYAGAAGGAAPQAEREVLQRLVSPVLGVAALQLHRHRYFRALARRLRSVEAACGEVHEAVIRDFLVSAGHLTAGVCARHGIEWPGRPRAAE